jgi:hypothetical protein
MVLECCNTKVKEKAKTQKQWVYSMFPLNPRESYQILGTTNILVQLLAAFNPPTNRQKMNCAQASRFGGRTKPVPNVTAHQLVGLPLA